MTDQIGQGLAVQQRVVHFHVGHTLAGNPSVQQVGDQVADEDGLAHPAWAQQHDGTPQERVSKQFLHQAQVGAWAKVHSDGIHPAAAPPRVELLKVLCNLLIGNVFHGKI